MEYSLEQNSTEQARRKTLITICTAVFFNVFSGTMISVALPLIGNDFGVQPARLGWVITAYMLIFGIAVPFYGRLGDIYGSRRLFVFGLCVFSLGSLLSAIAPNYSFLLAGRLIQAAGAGAIGGLSGALIGQAYPTERRGAAMGLMAGVAGMGSVAGPPVSGIISQLFGWPYLFVLNAAFTALLIPYALRTLPNTEASAYERLDVLGGVLLGLTVGSILIALTEAAHGDWMATQVIAAAAIALLAAMLLTLRLPSVSIIGETVEPDNLLYNREGDGGLNSCPIFHQSRRSPAV